MNPFVLVSVVIAGVMGSFAIVGLAWFSSRQAATHAAMAKMTRARAEQFLDARANIRRDTRSRVTIRDIGIS